jgi:hypothetical protein
MLYGYCMYIHHMYSYVDIIRIHACMYVRICIYVQKSGPLTSVRPGHVVYIHIYTYVHLNIYMFIFQDTYPHA